MQVTGAATITSLGTGFNGCRREVRFSGACTLTNSANLVLPGGANIVTAAGDVYAFRCIGSGQWALVGGSKDPMAVRKTGDTMTGTLTFSGAQDTLTSTRSGYQYSFANMGNGQWWLYDNTAAQAAWVYDTAGGGLTTYRGATRAGSSVRSDNMFQVYSGSVAVQRTVHEYGWNNAVKRWGLVMESTAEYALYAYDAAGALLGRPFLLAQNGNLGITGTGTGFDWVATSDARLKHEIRPAKVPAGISRKIKWKRWEWLASGETSEGVIAQELIEAGLGQFVSTGDDGTLAVNYAKLALACAVDLAGEAGE